MAPWRDGGGNRLFSTHVFGTPFILNEKGEAMPWIATAITSNDNMTVWTMKLGEDAVFQDGTPITAADFKAYWEHGAKPENIVAWGGASLSIGDILGWEELRAGDTREAEGLTVVDDHTLKIETYRTTATMPLYMAAWHVGISKFENGELDLMSIDSETYEAALDPGHPFNPLLYVSPYDGLWFIKMKIDMAPLEDLLVRKALAHGQDMESVVSAIWGPTATHAKGLTPSLMPCHDPDADRQPYDPDLAQQQLSDSTYGSGPDLPLLLIDLNRPNMVAMGVAMKEYWKDILDIELDVHKRESGMPKGEASVLPNKSGFVGPRSDPGRQQLDPQGLH